MQKLVNISDIELNFPAIDWKDAVKKSGAILVQNGYVTPRYVEAMVRTVKDFGPYIVIAPGLALAHARSRDGVLKSSISLVTLADPINFGNESNDPVRLVIGLAGVNDDAHLKILQIIAALFQDESLVGRICSWGDKAAISELFNNEEVEE